MRGISIHRSCDQLHNSLAGGNAEQGGMDGVTAAAPPLDPDPLLDP